MTVTLLLMVQGVANIVNSYFWLQFYKSLDARIIVWVNIAYATSILAFNVSHAMLAEKYVRAKHRAIQTLKENEDKAELSATSDTAFRCLFYLNIAFPLLSISAWLLADNYFWNH
jgi:hypothetical protein